MLHIQNIVSGAHFRCFCHLNLGSLCCLCVAILVHPGISSSSKRGVMQRNRQYSESKRLLEEHESFESLHSSSLHSSPSLWLLQSQGNGTFKKVLCLWTSASFSSPKWDQDSEGGWDCCIKQGEHGCRLFIIPLSKNFTRQNCNADWVMRQSLLEIVFLVFFLSSEENKYQDATCFDWHILPYCEI